MNRGGILQRCDLIEKNIECLARGPFRSGASVFVHPREKPTPGIDRESFLELCFSSDSVKCPTYRSHPRHEFRGRRAVRALIESVEINFSCRGPGRSAGPGRKRANCYQDEYRPLNFNTPSSASALLPHAGYVAGVCDVHTRLCAWLPSDIVRHVSRRVSLHVRNTRR